MPGGKALNQFADWAAGGWDGLGAASLRPVQPSDTCRRLWAARVDVQRSLEAVALLRFGGHLTGIPQPIQYAIRVFLKGLLEQRAGAADWGGRAVHDASLSLNNFISNLMMLSVYRNAPAQSLPKWGIRWAVFAGLHHPFILCSYPLRA